jgi:hypothetical protein
MPMTKNIVKWMAPALVLGVAISAWAEQPAGMAKKLVQYVKQGCKTMQTTAGTRRALAERFGKIRGEEGTSLRLEVAAFPGWKVSLSPSNYIDIALPADVVVMVGDLERYLGAAEMLRSDPKELLLPDPYEGCEITLITSGSSTILSKRRVLEISFND